MTRVRNATTGVDLVTDGAHARSFWAKFRGLMLRSALRPGEGLIFASGGSIHMFFMRFPIDVVYFDRDGKVTRVGRHVRPWVGFASGGRGARGFIELEAGKAAGVEPEHQLEFIDE